MTRHIKTKKLATMGILSAISVMLVMVLRIPFPGATFLEYDPADIPILIGTVFYGPLAGLAITFVASLIQAMTVSSASGFYGFIMHFVATGTMVLVVGGITRHGKTIPKLLTAFAFGSVAMTLVMVGLNLVITPIFMGVPVEQVAKMIVPIFVPFNLIKAVINSSVAFIIFKALQKVSRLSDGA